MMKNRVLYGVVFLLALFFVYLYKDGNGYTLLYTIILAPVCSYFIAYSSKYFFKITQHMENDLIVKGEEVVYHLLIVNKSIFSYSNVKVVFAEHHVGVISDTKDLYISLKPREEKRLSYRIFTKYRGTYAIGIKSIELMDFLGLFRFKNGSCRPIDVTVYPRVVDLYAVPFSVNIQTKMSSSFDVFTEDYTVISDVRPYTPADSLKKIHWKLSAKKDELIVKNFQKSIVNSVTIILDTFENHCEEEKKLHLEDRIIEGLVSVTNYSLKAQIPVVLLFEDGVLEEQFAGNSAQFQQIYERLSLIKFRGQTPVQALLEDYQGKHDNFHNMVIFTSNLNPALYEQMLSAKNFGHHILLYNFEPSGKDYSGLYSLLEESGIPCYISKKV